MNLADVSAQNQADHAQEDPRPGIAEYAALIAEAAKQKDSVDYPNSTVAHAEIAISKIIEVCKNEVGVFSRCFDGSFWNRLVVEIQDFLDADVSRTFRVVTAKRPSDDSMEAVRFLQNAYPERFSLRTVKKGVLANPNDCINFVYGDDFASRFEESDSDAKRGLVSAIVNFGNKERVARMKQLFTRLYEHAR